MKAIRNLRWLMLIAAFALIAAACGGDSGGSDGDEPTTTAAPADDGSEATTTTEAAAATDQGDGDEPMDAVEIRWFIGLGAGGQPEQRDAQLAVVDAFNASQDAIVLVPEIVDNDVAYDTLSTQIAAGNPPDIIGPVGRDGSNSYTGRYLDLEPLIEGSGFDTTRWAGAAVDNQREPDGTLVGLPFASFPSFVYFNTELFDEAGLPYPPQEYGADGTAVYGEGTEFEGVWDYDKVAEIGKILTVDGNGIDATDPAFDRTQTIQWGFSWQWTTALFQQGSFFGAGNVLQDDGSAAVPDAWADAWQWTQDAVWVDGIAPSQEQMDSDLLGGNVFSSGNVAMAISHLWYTCCVRDDDGNGHEFFDIAVMPSHNGNVTANMHADTFRILNTTEHPEEAFEALGYLLTTGALELLNAYGAAPADESLTEAFFASLDDVFPQGVNWQVALDSAGFADTPSHEGIVPGWDAYKLRLADLESGLLSNPDLDVAAEIATLETDLTAIFAENG